MLWLLQEMQHAQYEIEYPMVSTHCDSGHVPDTVGVSWVHGTHIGIAESSDSGATWQYRTTAQIDYKKGKDTYWAPEVIEHNGTIICT